MREITIGSTVKDKITGFKGFATARCVYITGCTQILVQPQMKKGGDFVEARWIDEDRLSLEKGAVLKLDIKHDGPDIQAPIR